MEPIMGTKVSGSIHMMSEIRLLGLNDQSIVETYLTRYPVEVSEFTFTNLFMWRKSRPIYIAQSDGSLVFLVDSGKPQSTAKIVFGPILGHRSPLDAVAGLGVEIAGFVRIPETTARVLQAAGLHVEEDRDNDDYVYRVHDLADLSGRRFHKKRNLVKQCLQAHDCSYEPISEALVSECLNMQDRWCEARQCGHDAGLCTEYVAVKECFAHWQAFALFGAAVRIDAKIQAFALGEKLRPGTAVCHFEKAMPGYVGLSQLINQWFARETLRGFEFENREQDLGIPGLRQAKESYFPDHMVHKFRAWFPGTSPDAVHPIEPHECGKHEKEG
jgi:hypothetical protein